MTAIQTSDPTRAVPTRRISFEESLATVPKHYAQDGDLIGSHLVAVLSALFPDGEDFFVKTVRHYRNEITDPELKRQVNGFIGQEAMHGREHRALNDRLQELGYPMKRVANLARRSLGLRWKIASPKANLAETAALEHFTATFAELALSSQELRDHIGHPAVRDLLVWHALEESEHKAVAFDVYRAVGGTERMRIVTMKVVRYAFVVAVTVNVLLSLAVDKKTYQRGELRRSIRRAIESPLLSRQMWRALKEYERPGFHPDDRNTDALVEEWRARLFGDEGTLNDKLVGASAA